MHMWCTEHILCAKTVPRWWWGGGVVQKVFLLLFKISHCGVVLPVFPCDSVNICYMHFEVIRCSQI